MELREKVANRIFASGMLREREGGDAALWEAALKLADFVLALPEIAEALEMRGLVRDHGLEITDKHFLGKPHEGVRVGHSISTGTKE